MAVDIITIGGLLVEIMRKETDRPFTQADDLTGPYPSGDVAIFIDTAARMGAKCGIIGAVGNDGFGQCLLTRLESDGVDTSLVRTYDGATTGTAFVAYFKDGSRNFIYHWRHAAAGMLRADSITPELVKETKWAHITGVNISVNEQCQQAVYRLLECLPASAKVSFDPNIRPEVLSMEEIRALCAPVLERADIFFPSKNEAVMFTGFITALNDGMDLRTAGEFANAVGALAVTKKGPMEGAKDKQAVWEFIGSRKSYQ